MLVTSTVDLLKYSKKVIRVKNENQMVKHQHPLRKNSGVSSQFAGESVNRLQSVNSIINTKN